MRFRVRVVCSRHPQRYTERERERQDMRRRTPTYRHTDRETETEIVGEMRAERGKAAYLESSCSVSWSPDVES